MSFIDILNTSQSIALANKLNPDETAIWHKICRDYSKLFTTPLHLVLEMDPEHVSMHVYADRFSQLDHEEDLGDIIDLVGSLSDPDYDSHKEKAFREENQKLLEEERERVRTGKAIHKSLEKNKKKDNLDEKADMAKTLPQSGGINMDLINKLQEDENER